MNNLTKAALSALLLSGFSIAGATAHPEGKNRKGQFFEKMDRDQNGQVTKGEFRQFRIDRFAEIDQDESASLSLEEMKAHRSKKRAERGRKSRRGYRRGRRMRRFAQRFRMMDVDGNQTISRSEFVSAGHRRFVRLDRNGDNVIEQNEMRRKSRRGRRGHRGERRWREGRRNWRQENRRRNRDEWRRGEESQPLNEREQLDNAPDEKEGYQKLRELENETVNPRRETLWSGWLDGPHSN